LIAAGADLDRVHRVEVIADTIHVGLSMPRDLPEVERAAAETGAAMLLLDPLMSRLDPGLDSHRDHEVRIALEPLTGLADRTNLTILGLIHHNKSGSTDPLQLVMGSRAFTAVARSIHTVMADPDDETGKLRLFGTPKNNLGRTDQPTLAFRVASHAVETDEGTAWTGAIAWADDSPVTIVDAMRRAASDDRAQDHSATAEATEWLLDHLSSKGGSDDSATTKKAGRSAGHTESAIRRARERLHVVAESVGYPRTTIWSLPQSLPTVADTTGSPSVVSPSVVSSVVSETRGEYTTSITSTTDVDVGKQLDSRVSRVSRAETPRARARLDDTTDCTCGKPLIGQVQQAHGMCNRCWTAEQAKQAKGG
jgi:hypothetical protein